MTTFKRTIAQSLLTPKNNYNLLHKAVHELNVEKIKDVLSYSPLDPKILCYLSTTDIINGVDLVLLEPHRIEIPWYYLTQLESIKNSNVEFDFNIRVAKLKDHIFNAYSEKMEFDDDINFEFDVNAMVKNYRDEHGNTILYQARELDELTQYFDKDLANVVNNEGKNLFEQLISKRYVGYNFIELLLSNGIKFGAESYGDFMKALCTYSKHNNANVPNIIKMLAEQGYSDLLTSSDYKKATISYNHFLQYADSHDILDECIAIYAAYGISLRITNEGYRNVLIDGKYNYESFKSFMKCYDLNEAYEKHKSNPKNEILYDKEQEYKLENATEKDIRDNLKLRNQMNEMVESFNSSQNLSVRVLFTVSVDNDGNCRQRFVLEKLVSSLKYALQNSPHKEHLDKYLEEVGAMSIEQTIEEQKEHTKKEIDIMFTQLDGKTVKPGTEYSLVVTFDENGLKMSRALNQ